LATRCRRDSFLLSSLAIFARSDEVRLVRLMGRTMVLGAHNCKT
jgi:hypothetical protein